MDNSKQVTSRLLSSRIMDLDNTTNTSSQIPLLRIGICGAARIAKKNIAAIQNLSSNCKVVAIASRSLEKVDDFFQHHVWDEWKDCVSIMAGADAYDQLINDSNVDALYVPLPVTVKKEWVIKALHAKKHVLCEKPVSTSAADYQELLSIAKKVGRYIMDGTMFIHNNRTQLFLDYIANSDVFGNVIRINTEFTFRGDEEFFANDIRTTKEGDPYGCIGDLGWYCVRVAQLVFGKVKGGKLTRAQTTYWKLNEEGVPMDAQCLVVFKGENGGICGGDDDDGDKEYILSFHCSFLHPLTQRVSIVGTKQTLEMLDYVIPKEGVNYWVVHGEDLTLHDTYSIRSSDVMEVPSGPVQEVLMWRNFSKYCREVENYGWCDGEANQVSLTSLENQRIVDALMESMSLDGKAITL
mmetsp:Transcript_11684/g.21844  ORF Transcript_11684/g.21844 Transcript_11684/m.21844 type:complete len:409 (+) Transcript_11684:237-1463(+)